MTNDSAASPSDHSAPVQPTDHPLRLVLMGTGPFAVPSFDALRFSGHEILMVVTKPMPPVKSRKGPPPSPVRQWAQQWQYPIFDPPSINEPSAVEHVAEANADLLVVCDYGQILKPSALETAKLGGINLHGSLLPKYRGAAPVQWALLSGDAVTGVSVIHMTPRLDGGPILTTRQTPIRDDETAGQLEQRLSIIGVGATLRAVERLRLWDGTSPIGQKQTADEATKAPRLSKADGEIDWGRTSKEIDCHVRGMQPWPIAYTHFPLGPEKPPVRLAVKEIEIRSTASGDHAPGEIIADQIIEGEIIAAEGLLVATADHLIEIKRLQPAGKREMSGIEFLRGHQPAKGCRLV